MTTVRLHLLSALFAATTYATATGAVPGEVPAALLASFEALFPARAETSPLTKAMPPVANPHRAVHSAQNPLPLRSAEIAVALR